MAKKRPSSEGGGNWMDTYGDLVTLLLTFFVMLYSMSTLDAKKWEIFVRSIGPNKSAEAIEDVAINAPLSE
ncbi:MAG: flagellar motor protein MotB, partial [Lachnospiraceae bacterium]|nr:flagellar motor protein MotB [Lachnospiraceae bacterium]